MKFFIEPSGEYNYTAFEADDKVFKIVGTEVPDNYKTILDVKDTFRSSDGVFSTRTRRQIYQAAFEGKITQIESSEIKIKSPEGKRKGRAV